MRLSLVLAKWPKIRPNGNIWIGKHKMVRHVEPKHMAEMKRDIEREKTNAFLCLHPAISKDEEATIQAKLQEELSRPDQIWFQMRKVKIEGSKMAPVPLSEHFNSLRKEEKCFQSQLLDIDEKIFDRNLRIVDEHEAFPPFLQSREVKESRSLLPEPELPDTRRFHLHFRSLRKS